MVRALVPANRVVWLWSLLCFTLRSLEGVGVGNGWCMINSRCERENINSECVTPCKNIWCVTFNKCCCESWGLKAPGCAVFTSLQLSIVLPAGMKTLLIVKSPFKRKIHFFFIIKANKYIYRWALSHYITTKSNHIWSMVLKPSIPYGSCVVPGYQIPPLLPSVEGVTKVSC